MTKAHKKFSTILVMNKIKIKTIIRYQYTLTKIAKIKKIDISKYQQVWGIKQLKLIHCW